MMYAFIICLLLVTPPFSLANTDDLLSEVFGNQANPNTNPQPGAADGVVDEIFGKPPQPGVNSDDRLGPSGSSEYVS